MILWLTKGGGVFIVTPLNYQIDLMFVIPRLHHRLSLRVLRQTIDRDQETQMVPKKHLGWRHSIFLRRVVGLKHPKVETLRK